MSERTDNAWPLVVFMTMAAIFAVYVWIQRRRPRKKAARDTETTGSTPAAPHGATRNDTTREGHQSTPRDLRLREVDLAIEEGDCVVHGCRFEAKRPMPAAVFALGTTDLWSAMPWVSNPGELPAVWRVETTPDGVDPCLCDTHHTIAVSAIAEKIANHHANYAQHVSQYREDMIEFVRHTLLEHLDGVENRMRLGEGKTRT